MLRVGLFGLPPANQLSQFLNLPADLPSLRVQRDAQECQCQHRALLWGLFGAERESRVKVDLVTSPLVTQV